MLYGSGAAAHHSDRNYPMFMNMPGMKIIVPSTPADAKGLLKTAIRDDDPCIVFEDGNLYGTRGEVPDDDDHLVPFGVASILKPGTDVTIVAIAGGVIHALAAAKELESQGVSAEVIDPRTLFRLIKKQF